MSRRSEYYLSGRKKYYPVGSDCVLYHAYWDGTATDHSTGGNDGTVVGATFVENGIHCDGTDDSINFPTPLTIGSSGISWYWWTKIHADGRVWETANYGGAGKWYTEGYASEGLLTIAFGYGGIGLDPGYFDLWDVDVWTLLVFVYDPVKAYNWTTYYKDGIYKVSASAGVQQTAEIIFTGWQLGGGDTYGHGHHTSGEFLVFNTAHDVTKILAYFNATKARYLGA